MFCATFSRHQSNSNPIILHFASIVNLSLFFGSWINQTAKNLSIYQSFPTNSEGNRPHFQHYQFAWWVPAFSESKLENCQWLNGNKNLEVSMSTTLMDDSCTCVLLSIGIFQVNQHKDHAVKTRCVSLDHHNMIRNMITIKYCHCIMMRGQLYDENNFGNTNCVTTVYCFHPPPVSVVQCAMKSTASNEFKPTHWPFHLGWPLNWILGLTTKFGAIGYAFQVKVHYDIVIINIT